LPAEVGAKPLDLALFSFIGLDEQRRLLLRRLRKIGIRSGDPVVARVEDAIYLPSAALRGGSRERRFGGILDAEGRPLEAAALRRKGRSVPGGLRRAAASPPERRLETEVVYLGPLFAHYGRFLLESLARIWYVGRAGTTPSFLFDVPTQIGQEMPAWVWRVLDAFGVPRHRLLTLDEPTRLAAAVVPEPLFEQLHVAHEGAIAPFREVAAAIAGSEQPSDQPLYLSRRLLSSRQRPVIGEALLEDILRENGFAVAHPETMGFEDQIRLVNRHRTIVSPVGSAAHAILFALHRPSLVLLTNRENIPANYFLCSALAAAPTTFVDCLGTGHRHRFAIDADSSDEPDADADARPQATPQSVEVAKVVDSLRQIGLLRSSARATLAASGPADDLEYDVAWFWARLRKASGKRALPLSPQLELEAIALSERAWPVAWSLARYYATGRQSDAELDAVLDSVVERFLRLAAAERDIGRLAHYRSEIASTAPRVARFCRDELRTSLEQFLAERLAVDRLGPPAEEPGEG